MKPETTGDILALVRGYVDQAALGAALELGLFWRLAEKPLPAGELARSLDIPLNRCQYWLQILCRLGLLAEAAEGYTPSTTAREAILNTLSRDTWAFQAREERAASLMVQNLALNLDKPLSEWQACEPTPPDYFQQVREDPVYARLFTHKLYEIHAALAEELAGLLDLRGIHSVLDLGGGSGVVSFALLRRHPDLAAVVVDVENVCGAGRELAAETGVEGRVTYLAADLLQDDLPAGFDLALLCDVGLYNDSLFRRIHKVLNPHGRLVIVDKFAPDGTSAPPSRLNSAFLYSLKNPGESMDFTSAETVQAQLRGAGFRNFSITPVPHKDDLPWNLDWMMLESQRDV